MKTKSLYEIALYLFGERKDLNKSLAGDNQITLCGFLLNSVLDYETSGLKAFFNGRPTSDPYIFGLLRKKQDEYRRNSNYPPLEICREIFVVKKDFEAFLNMRPEEKILLAAIKHKKKYPADPMNTLLKEQAESIRNAISDIGARYKANPIWDEKEPGKKKKAGRKPDKNRQKIIAYMKERVTKKRDVTINEIIGGMDKRKTDHAKYKKKTLQNWLGEVKRARL